MKYSSSREFVPGRSTVPVYRGMLCTNFGGIARARIFYLSLIDERCHERRVLKSNNVKFVKLQAINVTIHDEYIARKVSDINLVSSGIDTALLPRWLSLTKPHLCSFINCFLYIIVSCVCTVRGVGTDSSYYSAVYRTPIFSQTNRSGFISCGILFTRAATAPQSCHSAFFPLHNVM